MNDMPMTWVTADQRTGAPADATRVGFGYFDGAFAKSAVATSLATLFPHVEFVDLGANWGAGGASFSAFVVGAEMADAEEILKQLALNRGGPPAIVILRGAAPPDMRTFLDAGAAEVLAAPISEAALALSLERNLSAAALGNQRQPAGRLIALLKAGGGVGATTLGAQLTGLLAARNDRVCFADLDVQGGVGALALDIGDGMTLSDILRGAGALEDAPLATVLIQHKSGAKVLTAPRELIPLESIDPADVEGLMKALRRDFSLTLLDLPGAWTAWTHRILSLCDQIFLISNLTLTHVHLVKRQLSILSDQGLGSIPITLICNRVTDDQMALVPIKAAQQAAGRNYDFILPEDGKLMNAAIAQGVSLSAVRAGAKLDKGIQKIADTLLPAAAPVKRPGRFRWP
jgi:pilus assembly protein CpaE